MFVIIIKHTCTFVTEHCTFCLYQGGRPTPPHLTSLQAEQLLATACENEAQNAKRMRLGLEPVAQPHPYSQPQPAATIALVRNIVFEP